MSSFTNAEVVYNSQNTIDHREPNSSAWFLTSIIHRTSRHVAFSFTSNFKKATPKTTKTHNPSHHETWSYILPAKTLSGHSWICRTTADTPLCFSAVIHRLANDLFLGAAPMDGFPDQYRWRMWVGVNNKKVPTKYHHIIFIKKPMEDPWCEMHYFAHRKLL